MVPYYWLIYFYSGFDYEFSSHTPLKGNCRNKIWIDRWSYTTFLWWSTQKGGSSFMEVVFCHNSTMFNTGKGQEWTQNRPFSKKEPIPHQIRWRSDWNHKGVTFPLLYSVICSNNLGVTTMSSRGCSVRGLILHFSFNNVHISIQTLRKLRNVFTRPLLTLIRLHLFFCLFFIVGVSLILLWHLSHICFCLNMFLSPFLYVFGLFSSLFIHGSTHKTKDIGNTYIWFEFWLLIIINSTN